MSRYIIPCLGKCGTVRMWDFIGMTKDSIALFNFSFGIGSNKT